jgi:DNA-binding Lrp family transcriptional regulator
MKLKQMTDDDIDVGGRPPGDSDEEYINAVRRHGMATTRDVVEEVSTDRSQTSRRLTKIAERGDLVKKSTGKGNPNEWMLPETFEVAVPDNVFTDALGDEMKTLSEISEETGFNERACLQRLQKLEDEGRVYSKRPSDSGSSVWMMSN